MLECFSKRVQLSPTEPLLLDGRRYLDAQSRNLLPRAGDIFYIGNSPQARLRLDDLARITSDPVGVCYQPNGAHWGHLYTSPQPGEEPMTLNGQPIPALTPVYLSMGDVLWVAGHTVCFSPLEILCSLPQKAPLRFFRGNIVSIGQDPDNDIAYPNADTLSPFHADFALYPGPQRIGYFRFRGETGHENHTYIAQRGQRDISCRRGVWCSVNWGDVLIMGGLSLKVTDDERTLEDSGLSGILRVPKKSRTVDLPSPRYFHGEGMPFRLLRRNDANQMSPRDLFRDPAEGKPMGYHGEKTNEVRFAIVVDPNESNRYRIYLFPVQHELREQDRVMPVAEMLTHLPLGWQRVSSGRLWGTFNAGSFPHLNQLKIKEDPIASRSHRDSERHLYSVCDRFRNNLPESWSGVSVVCEE